MRPEARPAHDTVTTTAEKLTAAEDSIRANRSDPRGHRSVAARLWAIQPDGALSYVPIGLIMLAYAIYYSRLSVEIYRGYGSPGYDMGIFDQGVWLLSRFHAPFVTVMGRNLFGDHTSFILLFLVPVYWLYPHAAALLVIQSALIALGALPIYLFARHLLRDNMWATFLAGAFLLNPALQWGNLEQFHPECFLVPLVGFAIYAAVTWKPWLLIVSVGLCLLVKEDVALFVVPLGLWVAYRQNRRLGWKIVAAGVVGAFVATEVVIRSLLGEVSLYGGRIPFGGIHGFLSTVLRKPGRVADYLVADRRPFYLWQMTFPSALLFLRAPEVAAVAILVVASNVVSNFPYQHQIFFHYSLASTAVLAMGTVFAISFLKTPKYRGVAVGAVTLCSLWSCLLWGAFPPLSVNKVPHWKPSMAQVHDINSVLAAIPPDAVVSVHYSFIAHIDHRDRAYQWPTPFKASYWGQFKQEGQRLPFAGQVQYIALPTTLNPSDQEVLAPIMPDFVVVKQVRFAMLLKRL